MIAEVVADNVQFLGPKSGSSNNNASHDEWEEMEPLDESPF